jgi:hypothetical protein
LSRGRNAFDVDLVQRSTACESWPWFVRLQWMVFIYSGGSDGDVGLVLGSAIRTRRLRLTRFARATVVRVSGGLPRRVLMEQEGRRQDGDCEKNPERFTHVSPRIVFEFVKNGSRGHQ